MDDKTRLIYAVRFAQEDRGLTISAFTELDALPVQKLRTLLAKVSGAATNEHGEHV